MPRNNAQPLQTTQGLIRTGLVMSCFVGAVGLLLTYSLTWSFLSDIMHTLRIPYMASLLAGASVSHGQIYNTRFNGTTWDDKNWRITTNLLDQGHYQSRMSLANGYLGINVAAAGPFFEADTPVDGDNINGWPLFDR